MKIAICASMSAVSKMMEVKDKLESQNHKVVLPHNAELYFNGSLVTESSKESTANKIKDNLLKRYFGIIKDSDAVLVVNTDKNGVKNYIGSNTFLEMGFAYILNKKIYLLNEIPDLAAKDEIEAMQPIILNGDLDKIITSK